MISTLRKDAFWRAYAADRYEKLSQTDGDGGQRDPPKYLVFAPTNTGLGNRMVGMMSTFALSIAFDRVFLNAWIKGESM